MSLVELNQEEMYQVSGAGTLVGDSIILGVNSFNRFLNTGPVSAFGVIFSGIGIGRIHQLADTTGYVASKSLLGLGHLLGGDLPESENHYEKEKEDGLYTSIPTIITDFINGK